MAKLGTVALGAGTAMTLTFNGNRLLNLAVTGSTLNDLVENGKLIVADAGNYTLTDSASFTTADITTAPLTVTGVFAENKAYDETTADNIDTTGAALVGTIPGDSVALGSGIGAGTFAQKKVGFNIPVTADLSLVGTDAGNYAFAQPTGLAADILPNPHIGSRSPAGWIESLLLGNGWQATAPFGIGRYPNASGHHYAGWFEPFLLTSGGQSTAPFNVDGYPDGLVHHYNGHSILNLIGGGMLQP